MERRFYIGVRNRSNEALRRLRKSRPELLLRYRQLAHSLAPPSDRKRVPIGLIVLNNLHREILTVTEYQGV
jgi:hypothetical protein